MARRGDVARMLEKNLDHRIEHMPMRTLFLVLPLFVYEFLVDGCANSLSGGLPGRYGHSQAAIPKVSFSAQPWSC